MRIERCAQTMVRQSFESDHRNGSGASIEPIHIDPCSRKYGKNYIVSGARITKSRLPSSGRRLCEKRHDFFAYVKQFN